MPRKHRQILPFRIPFFRIFYSTTYTIVFLVLLVFLAITPGSLLWETIQSGALQYVFIIGGVYIVTALLAVFIYSSRLYTNRSVLAGVGKAYIPVEDGEVGTTVRRLIIGQLERSAIVAWEAKPRDIKGEIVSAEQQGLLTSADTNELGEIDTIGTVVPVDIERPPWGNVQHPGWTAPSSATTELQSNLQFEVAIKELPNLLEARAASLAPALPRSGNPDARFLAVLCRQEKMGLREYLTQLSFLRLIDLSADGRELLDRYERARFSGVATSYSDFRHLMLAFGNVMDSMKELDPAISEQIRAQVSTDSDTLPAAPQDTSNALSSSLTSQPSLASLHDNNLVTARMEVPTLYLPEVNTSHESFGSVLRVEAAYPGANVGTAHASQVVNDGNSRKSVKSDAGSVVYHRS